MIKLNIFDNEWQEFPLLEDKPIVEITEEQYNALMLGHLTVKNGEIVDNTENIALQNELQDLLTWFEEYDNQVKQYERSVRLGIEFDKDIAELDAQADINAARITEIRNLLKNSQNA